jgi:membrane protein implicated in regulation of membrane protease activity
MIRSIIVELGPWSWIVLGCALLAMEIAAPGFFLLWIGIAALVTGALSLIPGAIPLILWDASLWTWQVQVVVFLVLSLVFAYGGSRLMRPRKDDSDQPLLNRRSEQLIGKVATLTEPIRDGHGRVRIGDTIWRVTGPDLPAGAQVRVTAATAAGLELVVEAVKAA